MRRTEEEKREREREREREKSDVVESGREGVCTCSSQSVGEKKDWMRGRIETGRTGTESEQAKWQESGEAFQCTVWYGNDSTPYILTECQNSMYQSSNRTDHSASAIFGSYVCMYGFSSIASTRGHLDAFRVAKTISCGKDS